jgi:hypothetical protein
VWDILKASQVLHPRLLSWPPCLTEFTFEFIRRPVSPIISPSSRTFVEFNPRHQAMCFSIGLPSFLHKERVPSIQSSLFHHDLVSSQWPPVGCPRMFLAPSMVYAVRFVTFRSVFLRHGPWYCTTFWCTSCHNILGM